MDETDHHENFHSSNHQKSMEEGVEETENSKTNGKIAEKIEGCNDNDCDEQRKQMNKRVDDCSISIAAEMSTRASSPSETLTVPASASSDLHCNFEVPVEYALQPFESAEESKDKVGISKQEGKGIKDQAASGRTKNEQEPLDDPSSLELSPTSVTQSILSIPSPSLTEQRLSTAEHRNSSCVPGGEKQNSFDPSTLAVVSVRKTPSPDGYNWRKYGQKQVKSPRGSRSYYRCTYSDCHAKKIECSDESNHVMEIIYRSHHNHDPPRKVNCTRGSKIALSVVPVKGTDASVHAVGAIDASLPSTSSKDPPQETPPVLDSIGQESSGTDDNPEIDVKEHVDGPEPRKRLKKMPGCSGSVLKVGKKPKFVIHAAGDVGISGDGFRWRKYGQKMVKGNPHPRNYYRCTSAGCPVRKHIERAKDNSNAVIITYKDRHDHDMPVPKKRHGPPSAPLVAAAAPASMNTLPVTKSDATHDQVPATQWSVDKEGELTGQTLELGGEKAMESARTLLSIGFEIKPC